MSGIKSFIQNRLKERLEDSGLLIVYDPEGRYKKICTDLASEEVRVIDTTNSSILSREYAIKTLCDLGEDKTVAKSMLVYVPKPLPFTDKEKQKDPFSIYIICGRVFPEGDLDEYMSLCLLAYPHHNTEIRRIFKDNINPSFELIDAIDQHRGWPILETIFGSDSPKEIIISFLLPTESQATKLQKSSVWIEETKELFKKALGLNLVTRSTSWSVIANELWRFLLFSELVFDISYKVPESLKRYPHANNEAELIIKQICDRLRNDLRTQPKYIEKAIEVEKELNIRETIKDVECLGINDTFPFKEFVCFKQAVKSLSAEKTNEVEEILSDRANSIWVGNEEDVIQWQVVKSGLRLLKAIKEFTPDKYEYIHDLKDITNFYMETLNDLDRYHREFEQTIAASIKISDEVQEGVVEKIRSKYKSLANDVNNIFLRCVEKEGWPPLGGQSNDSLFNRVVSPRLNESGRKVAFFLIDSLRYELGAVLAKQLSQNDEVNLEGSFAQLPTVTQVGMASLLPGADTKLKLMKNKNGDIEPFFGDQPINNVKKRMDMLAKMYGERFSEMQLRNFINLQAPLSKTVELLVIRSTEIDSQLENDAEGAIGLLNNSLKRIQLAISKLKGMGFEDVIIATDHGFVLNSPTKYTEVCEKPFGEWVNLHERCLIGKGFGEDSNLILPADRLGIKGEFSQFAVPRALVAYRKGMQYFHGGLSLQEAILPVITLRLKNKKPYNNSVAIQLSYKNKEKYINSMQPIIDFSIDCNGQCEILLEAQDYKGEVVGEVSLNGPVNPATGTITIDSSGSFKIPMKMQEDFQGEFTVKAMSPSTLEVFSSVKLKTAY
ncbi:PglZ domain-containing protein [Thalassobacillus devorans]|uniref:PglZ domain-containing protein n=1 Tax=Thalassobacillus devorans TaxID=279813 RepID=UPI00048E9751|nr:PglZ domain-containing protein [Thalassobacillus devorans]